MSLVRPLIRPLVRPLVRSLVLDDGGGGPTPNDPRTDDILTLLTADGITPTAQQEQAIDKWFKAGWMDKYPTMRMWVPVWNNTAANEVDWSDASLNGFDQRNLVSHDGYIQGSGSVSGFGSLAYSASSLGVTTAAGTLFFLSPDIGTATSYRTVIGARDGDGMTVHSLGTNPSTGSAVYRHNMQSNSSVYVSGQPGVFMGTRLSGDTTAAVLGASGFGSVVDTIADNGTPPTSNYYVGAESSSGANTDQSDAKIGVFGVASEGIASADIPLLTADILALWESLTGQALPAPPSPAPPPEPEPLPYDLNGHTAAELIAFIEADFGPGPHSPGETAILQDLIDAERAGQNRSSLVSYLDALPGIL